MLIDEENRRYFKQQVSLGVQLHMIDRLIDNTFCQEITIFRIPEVCTLLSFSQIKVLTRALELMSFLLTVPLYTYLGKIVIGILFLVSFATFAEQHLTRMSFGTTYCILKKETEQDKQRIQCQGKVILQQK